MKEKLVSIITTCYNGEKTVTRYLESLLNQTYNNIELIFINDGSSDNTEKIVLSYEDKLKENGIRLVYVYQKNKGLGGAVSAGLKLFSGEYICWSDSDDMLFPESIKRRVKFLEENSQYACVTSDAYMYSEHDLDNPIAKVSQHSKGNYDEEQFIHHLKSESIFCTGCHMIRASAFLNANPKRDIYPARRGQNWQLLLPVYYKYKRGFIDEPLYKYIIYDQSMSSGDDTKEKFIQRYNEHLDIIVNTLDRIDMDRSDRKRYFEIYNKFHLRKMFELSIKYKDLRLCLQQYIQLLKHGYLQKYDTKSLISIIIKR